MDAILYAGFANFALGFSLGYLHTDASCAVEAHWHNKSYWVCGGDL
jgi:hypothetical protein